MKQRTLLVPILVSIIPFGLIILNAFDLFSVYHGKGGYPFGSEFFSSYSIYHSKTTYIAYNLVFILSLATTIYLAFKLKWKPFFFVLFLDVVFFFYPLFTNV